MTRRSVIAGLLTTFILGALIFAPVQANSRSADSDLRPGWGYGDTNHEHSGPAGKAETEHGKSGESHGKSK